MAETEYIQLQPLKQRYFTPNEANISIDHRANSIHKPVLLTRSVRDSSHYIQLRQMSEQIQAPLKVRTLDGFCLLETAMVGIPEDARQVVLPGKNFHSVAEDDLRYFSGLQFLDVSENHLNIVMFANLVSLKELRLPCNAITTIGPLHDLGFYKLQSLDLSYNKIDAMSIRSLYGLPALRDLDLSGNDLAILPPDMYQMESLEKLILERNKLDDNRSFLIFSLIPHLRVVSVAYNFLSGCPIECSLENRFKFLEYIDLAFNYFGSEADCMTFARLNRLHTMILYGNPILGPTGEDALRVYVEELDKSCEQYRKGYGLKFLEIVTEVPRRKVKKGQHLGRQAHYHDFKVTTIAKIDKDETKTTLEWRQEGQKTLFAEAMAAAKLQMMTRAEGIPDFTFITGGGAEAQNEADELAGSVMQKVASDMGIGNSAEILLLRDKALLPPTLMAKLEAASKQKLDEVKLMKESLEGTSQMAWMKQHALETPKEKVLDSSGAVRAALALDALKDEYYGDSKETDGEFNEDGTKKLKSSSAPGHHRSVVFREVDEPDQIFGAKLAPIADTVPTGLFQRTIATGNATLHSHPVEVQTAIRALRFALRNPLTNYSEVPGKGFLPPKGYAKTTQTAQQRALPPHNAALALTAVDHATRIEKQKVEDAGRRRQGRGLSESVSKKEARKESQMTTLRQIEEVLDSLNDSTQQIVNKGSAIATNAKDTISKMKTFARPNNTIDSLVDMIDEVIGELS